MGIDLIDPPKESMGNRSKSNGRSSTFMLNFPQAPPKGDHRWYLWDLLRIMRLGWMRIPLVYWDESTSLEWISNAYWLFFFPPCPLAEQQHLQKSLTGAQQIGNEGMIHNDNFSYPW